jgi:hypothetical protein
MAPRWCGVQRRTVIAWRPGGVADGATQSLHGAGKCLSTATPSPWRPDGVADGATRSLHHTSTMSPDGARMQRLRIQRDGTATLSPCHDEGRAQRRGASMARHMASALICTCVGTELGDLHIHLIGKELE